MVPAWCKFVGRQPMNTHSEQEWKKHVRKVKDRVRNVKTSSEIRESVNVLRPKPTKPRPRKLNEFDILKREEDANMHAWMDELRLLAMQESAALERKRRKELQQAEEEQRATEREERAARELLRLQEMQQRTEELTARRTREISARREERERRRSIILQEKDELQEKVRKEKEQRILNQAWATMSNIENYEKKRQRAQELQREREATLSSRNEFRETEKKKNHEKYLQVRARRHSRRPTSPARSEVGSRSVSRTPGQVRASTSPGRQKKPTNRYPGGDAAAGDGELYEGTRFRLDTIMSSRAPTQPSNNYNLRSDIQRMQRAQGGQEREYPQKPRFTPWKQENSKDNRELRDTLKERRIRHRQHEDAERSKLNSKFMWKLVTTKPAVKVRMSSTEEIERLRQLNIVTRSEKKQDMKEQLEGIRRRLRRSKPDLYKQLFPDQRPPDLTPLRRRVKQAEVRWR